MLPPRARARAEQLVHAYEERLSADVFGQPGRGAAAVAPSRPAPAPRTFHELTDLTPQAAARARYAVNALGVILAVLVGATSLTGVVDVVTRSPRVTDLVG